MSESVIKLYRRLVSWYKKWDWGRQCLFCEANRRIKYIYYLVWFRTWTAIPMVIDDSIDSFVTWSSEVNSNLVQYGSDVNCNSYGHWVKFGGELHFNMVRTWTAIPMVIDSIDSFVTWSSEVNSNLVWFGRELQFLWSLIRSIHSLREVRRWTPTDTKIQYYGCWTQQYYAESLREKLWSTNKL